MSHAKENALYSLCIRHLKILTRCIIWLDFYLKYIYLLLMQRRVLWTVEWRIKREVRRDQSGVSGDENQKRGTKPRTAHCESGT